MRAGELRRVIGAFVVGVLLVLGVTFLRPSHRARVVPPGIVFSSTSLPPWLSRLPLGDSWWVCTGALGFRYRTDAVSAWLSGNQCEAVEDE